MKRFKIAISCLLLVTFAQAQDYISMNNGSMIKAVEKQCYQRDIKKMDDGVIISYEFNSAEIIDDPIYTDSKMIYINGLSVNSNAGEPAFPRRIDSFTLPNGATAKLEIIETNHIDIPLNLSPARPTLSENNYEDYSKENVPPINSFDGWFPTTPVSLNKEMKYRGTPVAWFDIRPVLYNYETNTVRLFSKIIYKIKYVENRSPEGPKMIAHNDYFLDNTTILPKNYAHRTMSALNTNSIDITKSYLIITVPELMPAVSKIMQWKKTLGYNVILKEKNSWTASEVMDTVHAVYNNNNNLYYILIVGSHAKANSWQSPGCSICHYTDNFYGDLDGDWTPDICTGRLPVQNVSEAHIAIDKIISYEKNPVTDASFYQTGLNCTYFQSSDNYSESRRYAYTTERIKNYVEGQGKTVNRVYYTESTVFPTTWCNKTSYFAYGGTLPTSLQKPLFAWNGNYNDINYYINQGAFYVLHRDHGQVTGWANPYYTTSHMSSLSNGNKLPVVFSINCESGTFAGSSSRCFADSILVVNNGGAVAVFAATDDTNSVSNDVLAEAIFESIWPSPGLMQTCGISIQPFTTPVYELGALLKQGITTMVSVIPSPSSSSLLESYHCFGDPSMEIRTAVPQSFNNVSIIRTTNQISVDLGSESARISFYNTSTGECLCYEGTSAEYNGTSAATIVCIYAHNRIPYVDNPVYYIQNATVSGNITINSDVIKVGSNVTTTMPQGPVFFTGGGTINLIGNTVELQGETTVNTGTTLNINN